MRPDRPSIWQAFVAARSSWTRQRPWTRPTAIWPSPAWMATVTVVGPQRIRVQTRITRPTVLLGLAGRD